MSFSPLGLTPLLSVFDMPASLAFYKDVVGFSVVSSSPEVETKEGRFSHWMWLRFGQADIMLNTMYDSNERPQERPAKRSGDTVFYLHCTDIDEAYEELTARGWKSDPPKLAGYGLRFVSATDPDGYLVVFQEVARG